MSRSHRQRYGVFLEQLRGARLRAGVTQAVLAERLANTQTFVSKCERGERRLDLVEVFDFLDALGESPVEFIKELHRSLRAGRR